MKQPFQIDNSMFVSGVLFGLVIGGVIALFTLPKSGRTLRRDLLRSQKQLAARVDTTLLSDPVAESMAEGKAAARRRREELGFGAP